MAIDDQGEETTYDLYLGKTTEPLLFREDLYNGWISEDGMEFTSHIYIEPNTYFEFFSLLPLLEAETVYYWKVVAKDKQGGQTESEIFTFTTARINVNSPPAPELVFPADGAANVSRTATLEWMESIDPDGDPVQYKVYFGTNPSNLPFIVTGLQSNSYTFSTPLEDQQKYYWKIVAVDGYDDTEIPSDLWSFTVENYLNDAPVPPLIQSPHNGIKNVTRHATLRWEPATDKDGDPVRYDVYIDVDPDPKKIVATAVVEHTFKANLENAHTTYYWKVIARDNHGKASESTVHSFLPWEAPHAPLDVAMADVGGGRFAMGESRKSIFVDADTWPILPPEKPEHYVILIDFSIGKYEVTFAQFNAFLQATRSSWEVDEASRLLIFTDKNFPTVRDGVTVYEQKYPLCEVRIEDGSPFDFTIDSHLLWDGTNLMVKPGFENYPVTRIYYKAAELFADWIGKRLPTEAEWEFAARGGNLTHRYLFSGSDDFRAVGWYIWNSVNAGNPVSGHHNANPARNGRGTHSVGQKFPNELGIYDMSGNVREFCSDFYSETYYLVTDLLNPKGPIPGDPDIVLNAHVMRGGSWDAIANAMRVSLRDYETNVIINDYGIRIAGEHSSKSKHYVSGIILNESNQPVAGVEVTVLSQKVVTNAHGRYQVEVPDNFSGTIIPLAADHYFSPETRNIDLLKKDMTELNFKARFRQDHLVSGTIRDASGNGISDVALKGFPYPIKSDQNGFYQAYVPASWSATVIPERLGYRFSTGSVDLENIVEDQAGVDFTAHYVGSWLIVGIVKDIYGHEVTGVKILGLPEPVTTNNGQYALLVTSGWSGILTASKEDFVFSPRDISINDIQSNQTDQNFTGQRMGYVELSGTVKDEHNQPLDNIEIKGFDKIVKTDVNGNYSVSVAKEWSGKFFPVSATHSFTPAYAEVENVISHGINNFTGAIAVNTYTISGSILNESGNSLANVLLHGLPGEVKTGINGQYTVQVEGGWSGTITPKLAGYTFTPPDIEIAGIQSNYLSRDFTGRYTGQYTISGKITSLNGTPLSEVVITGFPSPAITNDAGTYTAFVPQGWSGTIYAALTGYTFDPATIDFVNVQASLAEYNFKGSQTGTHTVVISGTIRDTQGQPLAGIQLDGFTQTVSTDASGHYSTAVPPGWSGMITPVKNDYSFQPVSRTYTDVQVDKTEQDYMATDTGKYIISGYVRHEAENPKSGIILHGFPAEVTTGTQGEYTVEVPLGWSGEVRPISDALTFTPESRSYTTVTQDYTNENYTAAVISGIGDPAETKILISPNPSEGMTQIDFAGISGQAVLLILYDSRGKEVTRFTIPPGESEILWDGTDGSCTRACSGMYFCHLLSSTKVIGTGKIIVIR